MKRGPQVLALDRSLNPFIYNDSLVFGNTNKLGFVLFSSVNSLPENWVGKQAYSLNINDDQGTIKKVILVPFSDAGQTGEDAMVWIKGL